MAEPDSPATGSGNHSLRNGVSFTQDNELEADMIRKRISLLSLIALAVVAACKFVKARTDASRTPAGQSLNPAPMRGIGTRPGLSG